MKDNIIETSTNSKKLVLEKINLSFNQIQDHANELFLHSPNNMKDKIKENKVFINFLERLSTIYKVQIKPIFKANNDNVVSLKVSSQVAYEMLNEQYQMRIYTPSLAAYTYIKDNTNKALTFVKDKS